MAEVVRHYSNFQIPQMSAGGSRQDLAPPTLAMQAQGVAGLLPAGDDRPVIRLRRLTARDVAEAVRLYAGGRSLSAIARDLGMSWDSVARLLDRAGVRRRDAVVRRPGLRRGQIVTAADVAEAGRLRAAGWSYRQIGEKFGVSREAVRQRLLRAQAPGGG
jgi:DNA-binding CsgD family transcriptional regulator